jgi:hypothetical protein
MVPPRQSRGESQVLPSGLFIVASYCINDMNDSRTTGAQFYLVTNFLWTTSTATRTDCDCGDVGGDCDDDEEVLPFKEDLLQQSTVSNTHKNHEYENSTPNEKSWWLRQGVHEWRVLTKKQMKHHRNG